MYQDQGYEILAKVFSCKDVKKLKNEMFVSAVARSVIERIDGSVLTETHSRDVTGGVVAFCSGDSIQATIRTFPRKRSAFVNVMYCGSQHKPLIDAIKKVAFNLEAKSKTYSIMLRN